MNDEAFDRFVISHAPVIQGFCRLVIGDPDVLRDVTTGGWSEVYRRWPRIVDDDDRLALALRPFVSDAIRRTRADEPAASGGLELREDTLGPAETVLSREPDLDLVGEALRDLTPRQRALVALRWYVGVDEHALSRAIGWWPPRPAQEADRALRDLMLTVAPHLAPPGRVAGSAWQHEELLRHIQADLADRAGVQDGDGQDVLAQLRPHLAGVEQQGRPPATRRRIVLAATAVAAALVVGIAVSTHRPDEPQPPAQAADSGPPPSVPIATPGMQLVGFQTVYTQVPASWSHNRIECGRPAESTVVYPDASDGCRAGSPMAVALPPSSVTFNTPPTSLLPIGPVRTVNQVGEDPVYATVPRHRAGLLEQIVLIPDRDVQMIVRTPDEHVLDDIVDSLQPVPTGYTVVPPCMRLRLRDAIDRLDDAGLRVRITQSSTLSDRFPVPPVTHQSIDSGQLVPVGTVVGLGFPSMN
ncbi:MAG TPA: hypothetical protein VH419_15365 [Nocardioidaceae bacterium]